MRRRTAAFPLVGLAAATLAAGAGAIRAYDFGWHLAAGNWILVEGRWPAVDPLSYTSAAARWIDHEWLFQLLLAVVIRLGGVPAAWVLKEVVLVATLLMMAGWGLKRHTSPLAVVFLGLLSLAGVRFRLLLRPELAGLALLPLVIMLLVVAREGGSRRRRMGFLLPVPLLIGVWANLHLSAFLGILVVWIFTLTLALPATGGVRPSARPFLAVALLSTVACLVNPYGLRLLEVPFRIRAALGTAGIANPEWGSSFSAGFWLFWVTAAGLQLGFYQAWRHKLRPSPALWLCSLGLTVLGAAALRFVGFFFMALPVLVFGALEPRTGESSEHRVSQRSGRLTAGFLALTAAGLFLLFSPAGARGAGLWPGRFPEAMAQEYRQMGIQGPFYNPVRFGGYLSWRLAPEKVFLDGRNELHAQLLARLGGCRISTDLSCWEAIMDRWNVQAAFVEYDPRRIRVRLQEGTFTTMSAGAVYFRRQIWALVDWDDTAMLLVRRTGPNHALAVRWEDHLLTPDDPDRFSQGLRSGRIDAEAALLEVDRRLKKHPGSVRGRRLRGLIMDHLSPSIRP